MKTFNYLAFLCCTILLTCAVINGKKTLLISLDGFRWDYINKTNTPNFDKLLLEGSQVKQVTNAFATLTMPNHWTLVTGMYEEDHGLIANKFFDPKSNKTYSFSRETEWYNNTEPIWITAEREGKRSGAYMWAGNQAKYGGKGLTKMTPFKSGVELEDSADIVTHWLLEDKLDFACLYTNQPDSDGHSYGPNSDEVKLRIRKIDRVLGKLMDDLDEFDMTDEVNILIASDHGMTDVSSSNMIDLSLYINFDTDIEWSYVSAIALLIPKTGQAEQVYTKLKAAETAEPHMKVYRKDEIPADLKYKNNDRIPEVVVVADNGWLMKKSTSYNMNMLGNHGFDNKNSDMKTTFLARGPDFKRNYKQEEMKSVDLYPLLCHLLDLQTCHTSRGAIEKTTGLLSNGINSGSVKDTTKFSIILSLSALAILL